MSLTKQTFDKHQRYVGFASSSLNEYNRTKISLLRDFIDSVALRVRLSAVDGSVERAVLGCVRKAPLLKDLLDDSLLVSIWIHDVSLFIDGVFQRWGKVMDGYLLLLSLVGNASERGLHALILLRNEWLW